MKRFTLDIVGTDAVEHLPFSNTGQFEIENCPVPCKIINPHSSSAHIEFINGSERYILLTKDEHASITHVTANGMKRRTFKNYHTLQLKKYLVKRFGLFGTHMPTYLTSTQPPNWRTRLRNFLQR